MRAQRAPLRLTVSPARLCRAVYAGFLAVRWRTILAWDSKSHGGTMPEGYLHLTCEQRCQIYALLQSGHSQAHIARKMGVDPSTISRELVRNTGARGYRFKQAHEKAMHRRKKASDKPRKMTPDLVELIEEKLTREQWSPDQISGRLAKDGVAFISHERIYQHVWKDKKDGGALHLHLSQRQKIQQAERQEFGARVDSEPRRHRSATFHCRRQKPHRRLGGGHNYRCQSQRRCHVARRTKIQIHQARQAAGQDRGLCRTGLHARTFAARRPHQNNHLRQWKRVRLSRRDRNLAGVAILFCQTLSLVGTRPQRTHQRPIQTVLPKGLRSLYCVRYRCPRGRG